MQIITASQFTKDCFSKISQSLKYSEMHEVERLFLTELILKYKPKKVLEVGISAGASSVIILNALQNIQNSHLYSIDFNTFWYRDSSLKTGFVVDDYQQLKQNWSLFTGNMAYKFMDEIGGDIDFAFIDTVHANPGEILDYLMILPYLKDDAVIVFHDTNLHTCALTDFYRKTRQYEFTNNLILSAINGQKLINGLFDSENSYTYFSNIAAIKINNNTKENIWDIFNLLTIDWQYMPSDDDLNNLAIYFKNKYGQYYEQYFSRIIFYQKELVKLKNSPDAKKYLKNFELSKPVITTHFFNSIKISKTKTRKRIYLFGLKILSLKR